MRSSPTRSYLVLLATLVLLTSLSVGASEKLRGSVVAFLAPLWESFIHVKEKAKSPFYPGQESDQELQQLRLEKRLLSGEVSRLRQMKEVPKSTQKAVPSRVIFRSPSSWYSSLWINVGEADNGSDTNKIIAKNSPVMLGESLIGVIDYVGTHQSRVRLITDSGLAPSVRAVRGGEQYRFLQEQIVVLTHLLNRLHDLPQTEKASLIEQLNQFKTHLKNELPTSYMAKGELHGTSQPLWRNKNNLIKGSGFNYDFADEKGEARDLRTGKIFHDPSSKPEPLLKVGDLLVTTGMDGVFPEGLKVAEVTKIYPLKEGDFYYNLEAKPTAGRLDDLSVVFVIPPLGYEASDQPPFLRK